MAEVMEFKLPDLGEGLTGAEIVRWLVQVGDVVAVDQPVVEVETAKAMVDVPCPYGGVVTARYGDEGTEMPVGAPLLTVAVPGDRQGSVSGAGEVAGAGSRTGRASGTASGETSGNVLVGYGTGAPAARRRRVRQAPTGHGTAQAPAREAPSGTAPRSTATSGTPSSGTAPVSEAADDGVSRTEAADDAAVRVISPLVRRLARERGLDLRALEGTGPEGLITRADVENAGAVREPVSAPAPAPEAAAAATERIPLRGIRGAAADKFARSRREIPDVTVWVDADATELLAARRAMNTAGAPKVSLLALLARVCTAALARYPDLNSTVDTEAREIVRLPAVHLGFAAQTDRGLVVPVVRDAHRRSAADLSAEMTRLTEAARAGALTPGEMTGGTFTLNNYGVFGVDGSTPIINHPEAGMLGVGRIARKPWVHGGELAARDVVQLSFTFDHRVCDGGTAGGFLRYVADCIENPSILLRSL